MSIAPITDLVFKGTHNSYACGGQPPPLMGHPPAQQIDDSGVWSVELDFAVRFENSVPRAVVGHGDAGEDSCWGYYLHDYIQAIHDQTRSRAYRPVLYVFDVKDWGDTDVQTARSVGVQDLVDVYGPASVVVLTDEELDRHLPTVPELAGKAVLLQTARLPRGYENSCTSLPAVRQAIDAGTGLENDCLGGPGGRPPGCAVIGIDQYQADWTFTYGVPPNPIVVDSVAEPPWIVTDVVPLPPILQWRCDTGDSWSGSVVREQGTWRFPYRAVTVAVDRARGIVAGDMTADRRRAGHGWTMLLAPGVYAGPITIDIPLRLVRDPERPGRVTIGASDV
jgi:hypothetical protein